jgi:hypothetical protein
MPVPQPAASIWSSFIQPLLRNWMELPPQVQVVLLLAVVLALWAARETYTTLLLILDELGVLNALDAIVGCCCPTRLWGRLKHHIEFAGMPKLEIASPVASTLRSIQPADATGVSNAAGWRSTASLPRIGHDRQQQQGCSQKPQSWERAAARALTTAVELQVPELEPLPDWCLTYDAQTGGVDTVKALRQRRGHGARAACSTEAEETSRLGALEADLAGAPDESECGLVGTNAASTQRDTPGGATSLPAMDALLRLQGFPAGSTPQGAGALPSPHTNNTSLPLLDGAAQSNTAPLAARDACRLQAAEDLRGAELGPVAAASAVAAVSCSAANAGGVQATCAAPMSRLGCAVAEVWPGSLLAGQLHPMQPG